LVFIGSPIFFFLFGFIGFPVREREEEEEEEEEEEGKTHRRGGNFRA
jgi:hypothetical protein